MRIDHATPPPSPTDVPDAARQPRVVVALHEGFFGAESGTGFSNRAFLTALTRLLPPGRLSVITPHVPQTAGAHDRRWTSEVQQMLRQVGAEVITIPEVQAPPDSIHGSVQLCDLAGEAALRIADRASRSLLIGLDIPFLGLAPYTSPAMDLLLIPRSTTALTRPKDMSRVRWERDALRAATTRGGRIGAISSHMQGHLIVSYDVPRKSIVSVPNGLIREEMAKPVGAPPLPFNARAGFLLAMGRAVPTKGFDDLLEALRILKERKVRTPHLLLAAVTADEHERPTSYQEDLAAYIRRCNLDATLITHFTPAIRAWLHNPALRAIIVPSREEPFGRIPLEAFAAGAGPVVATTAGGLAQTVVDGETGFTAMPRDPESLASALHRALTVLPRERDRLRSAGAALVRSRHNYAASIGSVIKRIAPWALAPSPTAEGRGR
ncbi:glycosyltransferase family 4 protein [Streptomyces chiangmaiensis]|uniref:D-inositol 3-phosphate glycosyltransferase n=1 Tax=Streptomyces chiangmaiensis TaxID=766497 RepID=A0ABU7FI80_9ACTN|nr:glycosyltransferase family 4 protein [Streptomyces chiangmaiensis]MED7823826.1 glycosyltransferase family 4 protein [Streptomyces chiangmaiensis]